VLSKSTASKARRESSRDRSGKVRAAILAAARKICFAEGADGVSARRIAKAIGTSPMAIYVHFRNIEDVLHHLRMEGHAILAEYLRSPSARLSPLRRVIEMQRAYYRFGVEHPNHYQLMFLVAQKAAPTREAVQREIGTLLMLRDLLVRGIDTGSIRADLDPMILANGVWLQIHGLTSLTVLKLLVHTAPGHEEALLEATLEAIERWLRPATPRRAS
jgi:AcrR family transcriptional regulator